MKQAFFKPILVFLLQIKGEKQFFFVEIFLPALWISLETDFIMSRFLLAASNMVTANLFMNLLKGEVCLQEMKIVEEWHRLGLFVELPIEYQEQGGSVLELSRFSLVL